MSDAQGKSGRSYTDKKRFMTSDVNAELSSMQSSPRPRMLGVKEQNTPVTVPQYDVEVFKQAYQDQLALAKTPPSEKRAKFEQRLHDEIKRNGPFTEN